MTTKHYAYCTLRSSSRTENECLGSFRDRAIRHLWKREIAQRLTQLIILTLMVYKIPIYDRHYPVDGYNWTIIFPHFRDDHVRFPCCTPKRPLGTIKEDVRLPLENSSCIHPHLHRVKSNMTGVDLFMERLMKSFLWILRKPLATISKLPITSMRILCTD
jgi:hypothetical protein